MKINKLVVIICIFLSLLIIGQLIYFNFFTKSNKKTQIEIEAPKTEYIIGNMEELYKYYPELTASREEIGNCIYKLIIEDFSIIYKATKDFNGTQTKAYYEENQKLINEMGINSSNDFILIAEELKYSLSEEQTMITNINVQFNEEPTQNADSFIFDLIIEYSNNSTSNIKCIIAMNNDIDNKQLINFKSNSQIAQFLNKISSDISVENILNVINMFSNNIKRLYDDNKLTSENRQAQYYQYNEAVLNQMGIYSVEDFQNILMATSNNLTWKINQTYDYYVLDTETYTTIDGYYVIPISFIFDNTEQLVLKLNISEKANVVPNVKLTGDQV